MQRGFLPEVNCRRRYRHGFRNFNLHDADPKLCAKVTTRIGGNQRIRTPVALTDMWLTRIVIHLYVLAFKLNPTHGLMLHRSLEDNFHLLVSSLGLHPYGEVVCYIKSK